MDERTLTVSELGQAVRDTLDAVFPYGVWVAGEISSLNRGRNGHVWFDLVEPSDRPGAPPVATVPVVLFREHRDRVNKVLKRHGDPIRMNDGVQIRIQGVLDYYPPSGRLQVRMSMIDPTYTLGRLAADRELVLTAMAAEGLVQANARRSVPAVPLRVGVVTSLGSAAHADITTVFESSGHAFTLIEVDSAVQGDGAERSVAAAIHTVGRAGVDVLIVARGGGSRTDLAVFDHEAVARAIAAAPVPVFTGVGHDIDRSVADEMAHTAHTTPTAAAQAVVARVDAWLHELAQMETALATRSRRAIDESGRRLDEHRRAIRAAAGTSAVRADTRLERAVDTLRRRAGRPLVAAARRVDTAATRARALDPAVALARGWSITRTADGRVLRSIDDAAPGDEVTTQLADGTLRSTIAE